MRYRIAEIIAIVALALGLAACNQTANENANANANANMANANANRATANANANANSSTRKAPTREEYEKNKESYAEEAKKAGRKIGTGLNDGWLWTKARFELAAADDLRDSTINVDVENAVVTLTGTVANAQQKAKAESTVKALDGVKSVKNMLKVSPSGNTNMANTNANANRAANTKATPKKP
jgi:osmotically-inducible protein OsmY